MGNNQEPQLGNDARGSFLKPCEKLSPKVGYVVTRTKLYEKYTAYNYVSPSPMILYVFRYFVVMEKHAHCRFWEYYTLCIGCSSTRMYSTIHLCWYIIQVETYCVFSHLQLYYIALQISKSLQNHVERNLMKFNATLTQL